MPTDLTGYTTDDLLRMIHDGEDHGEDFAYRALWGTVFARWRKGIDLDPLLELLQSEKSGERQRGAWYLEEAHPPADLMVNLVAKQLRDEPIGTCRYRFVAYLTNCRFYDDAIAECLAASLLDADIRVRVRTIWWAVMAKDETFAHFSDAVLSGAGTNAFEFRNPETTVFWRNSERKRAERGIAIARRLRAGESVAKVREDTPEEDSASFDELVFLDRRS